MKIKSIIGLILIMVSITSCNQLPKTSCGCWQSSIKKMDRLDKKDSIIMLFNPNRKAYYQHDLAVLYASAKRMDDFTKHCREIYVEQGLCREKSISTQSLWDYGGLITPGNEEWYRRKYSGDWEKDSIRFGPRGPVTMEDIKERVLFRLWHKVEVDNLTLTDREQKFLDSMESATQIHHSRVLYEPNDSNLFPRMWDDSKTNDSVLQNYLKREQYH